MDDSTFTSDAAAINRHTLLEQLAIIRSLMHKKCTANDDAATAAARNRNVVEGRAKEGVRLINDQMAAVSTELLLTVMSDMMLLRLLDGLGLEEGRAVSSDASSSDQLMDDAAAANKKKRAAAKKKRNKRNKAAAKHKKTNLISWLSGGIISVIMMVAFSFISTPIVTLSLFQPSDGSGEGNAPPALPPSASKSLRQKDLQQDDEASNSPDIIRSPLAAVVPPPVFAPAAVSNRDKKLFDEMRESMSTASAIDTDHPTSHNRNSKLPTYSPFTPYPAYSPINLPPTTSPSISANPSTTPCFDTPNWKDIFGEGCDYYRKCPSYCSEADDWAGDMGVASNNCCICGGGSHSLPPTNSPTISNSPTKSANPSSSPSSKPSSSPTKSAPPSSSSKPSSFPSISSSPTQGCFDTPNWKDTWGYGCDWYREYQSYCPYADNYAGDMGPATTHCCICDGGGSTTCEDFRSECQKYMNVLDLGFNEIGLIAPVCKKAQSCSCEAADHDVKIVKIDEYGGMETFGLHNECKCDFWLRLCEDTQVGEACDYAAEYCCGDYWYDDDQQQQRFFFLNSPTCYCDFFNYAQEEFGHTLKPKALNISKEFDKPCGQIQYFFDCMDNERLSLEAIYNKTDGQNWKNKAGWMNETVDHCNWHGITCDSDSLVTSIDLRDNNLAGQFPVYSRNETTYGEPVPESWWMCTKYGLANLYFLKSLDLANNNLTGTIDYRPLYNLYSLTHFDVSGNQLSGGMDALITPSLTHADFHNNRFTSMRRFKKIKPSFQTLRFCDVSNNEIKNDASDLLGNIPPNIEQFFASNNLIYGNLPASLSNLPKLIQFDMSSNALSGSLPDFTDSILSLQQLDLSQNRMHGKLPASLNNLPKLRQFDMSSNALTGRLPDFTESFATLQKLDVSNQTTDGFEGPIPENIWRSLSLQILNLADNRLTGSIPSLVGNLAVLEVFNLSNNFLKSMIPAELGMLAGTLKRIGLANNTLSGTIPSQLGQLQGATVLLKGNHFQSNSIAPLSLCLESEVEKFDLATNVTLCPPERNALSDFYDSTKGAEWTDGSLWLDEYASYCDWNGVTCDNSNRVIKLELRNNGLSGRLSNSIGDLTFIKVLDLSDNDIKGSIPTEVSQLSELTYLRLSYNAFTGIDPEGLGKLSKLQLLQLQSNRITEMPNMAHLDKSKYNKSAFVTDCGVPSAFDEAPECGDCTMCCNANDDCYPQEKITVADFGYSEFAAVFFACFIVICLAVALSLFLLGKRKNRGNTLTVSAERRLEEDDTYALSRIGKESVYSYFVTDKPIGWLAAFYLGHNVRRTHCPFMDRTTNAPYTITTLPLASHLPLLS